MYKDHLKTLKIKLFNLALNPTLFIYLISAAIYLPWFLPNLSDIGPYDETYYLISGRHLLAGNLPDLASGPLISLLYQMTYLPFRNSPFWLIHANSLGRFLLFSFLFMATYFVGGFKLLVCIIRGKATTNSGTCRPSIPEQTIH